MLYNKSKTLIFLTFGYIIYLYICDQVFYKYSSYVKVCKTMDRMFSDCSKNDICAGIVIQEETLMIMKCPFLIIIKKDIHTISFYQKVSAILYMNYFKYKLQLTMKRVLELMKNLIGLQGPDPFYFPAGGYSGGVSTSMMTLMIINQTCLLIRKKL